MLPDVPPLAEQGVANFDISLWFGMWAPAGTPAAVVQKLNAQVNAVVQLPAVREQFAALGIDPAPMQPEEFARFVREQIATYRGIVRQAGIEPQ